MSSVNATVDWKTFSRIDRFPTSRDKFYRNQFQHSWKGFSLNCTIHEYLKTLNNYTIQLKSNKNFAKYKHCLGQNCVNILFVRNSKP